MSKGYRAKSKHRVPRRVVDRIWDRIRVGSPTECWPWLLSIGSHGYGQVGWQSRSTGRSMTTAHRVAWMAHNGGCEIPEGMTVNHVCHNRVCCNPFHLRLLPNRVNARDNGHSSKTHCPHGHPYSEENTYINNLGHRSCRACILAKRTAR